MCRQFNTIKQQKTCCFKILYSSLAAPSLSQNGQRRRPAQLLAEPQTHLPDDSAHLLFSLHFLFFLTFLKKNFFDFFTFFLILKYFSPFFIFIIFKIFLLFTFFTFFFTLSLLLSQFYSPNLTRLTHLPTYLPTYRVTYLLTYLPTYLLFTIYF